MPNNRSLMLAVASLYWLMPGHINFGWSPSPNFLSITSIVAIFAIYALLYTPLAITIPATAKRVCVILFLISVALSFYGYALSSSHGMSASYFNNEKLEGAPELSPFSQCPGCTRLDQSIDFGTKGYTFDGDYFPVFFANNTRLRTYNPDVKEIKKDYRFSARWNGFIHVGKATDQEQRTKLKLTSSGGSASITIKGIQPDTDGVYALDQGDYELDVTYIRNTTEAPSLRLLWNFDGNYAPVPNSALSPAKTIGSISSTIPTLAGLVLWCISFLILAFSLKTTKRTSHTWLVNVLFFFAISSISMVKEYSKRDGFGSQLLTPGNDWLYYESLSRDILLGDYLTRSETPFVFLNFGYRYILSFLHILAGESPIDALILQILAMAGTVTWIAHRVYKMYGKETWIAFIFIATVTLQLFKFSFVLLDTTWSILFSSVALLVLISFKQQPSLKKIVLAGSALGLAILLRPNFLPFVPLAVIWMIANSPAGVRSRYMQPIVFAVIVIGISSLLGIRNHVVSDRWQFLPTNGLANIWIGNCPKQFCSTSYFQATLPADNKTVIPLILEDIRQNPRNFLDRVARKSLFILVSNQFSLVISCEECNG